MNKENTLALINHFPKLYAGYSLPPTQNLMCFGFECGDGWFKIIWDLSEEITKEIEKLPETEQPYYYAFQVKEKYGTLRFYMTLSNDQMEEAIDRAEQFSRVTCERCGKPGTMRGSAWVYVSCNECDQSKGAV